MPRFASIDIGTNSVLLLVAERHADGRFEAVAERAEITRLGRGVDQTRTLSPAGMEDTVRTLEAFAAEARRLEAAEVVVSATSAARDASNGAQFLALARARAGLEVQIISGDEEARLAFSSAHADFGGARPLVVLDIGGGSTEFIYGDVAGKISFRQSFDIGSVRLTERLVHTDPPSAAELAALDANVRSALAGLPRPPPGARLIGVAGTVTTVFAVAQGLQTYDAARVHGAELGAPAVAETFARLAALPLAQRRTLPGLQPKRADVIVAGAAVLQGSMRALGATTLTVSDKGLRWGLLADRFGRQP